MHSSSSRLRCAPILAGLVVALTSCSEGLDTTRQPGPRATFGDDLYGVLCDRVGAQVFQEDLAGQSYRPVCHYDEQGAYGDTVDVSELPKPTGAGRVEARRVSIAKMEALARRRSDLVRAFNATFPDIEIDNLATKKEGDTIRLHDALLALGQKVVPLYDSNPYDPKGQPLAPATTQALGRLFDSLAQSGDSLTQMSSMWGRQGYRPFHVGLGAISATLAYPGLRGFTQAQVGVLGPNGYAAPQLQALLSVGEREMLHAKVDVSNLPDLALDEDTGQLNRPRSDVEMIRDLLLYQDDRFAESTSTPPRYISLRDRRGLVVPAGNVPGIAGTVPSPFVDLDHDGYADVDVSGRFLDAGSAPLDLAMPFTIPGVDMGATDAYGRPTQKLYTYVDTSRTLASGLVREMQPLLDSTEYADANDPNAFEQESETMMYLLSGAYDLFGQREDAEYDFENDRVVPVGTGCPTCMKYNRFRGEDSPLPDLAHAAGQILADPDSDAVLLGMSDLLENHEQEVARLVGAMLKLKEISDQHPEASLPYENPLWDQMAAVLSRITARPGLTTALLGSVADDVVVTPIDGAANMGDAIAKFAGNRDLMTYDPGNLNGPAINLSVGNGQTVSDPTTPVDFNAPRSGLNRSLMERALLLIHDSKKTKACNKEGAFVKAELFGLTVDWPLTGSNYHECELFEIDELAAFYLDSILDPSHPKRGELVLKSNTLNSIIDFLGFASTPDELFQQSSGIDGMTLHPDSRALNRLVWFGARSDAWGNLPDFDALNEGGQTESFIHALMEPAGSAVCPPSQNGVATCASGPDLLRARDYASIFTWERLGFYSYLRPMLTAFVNSGCNADVSFCDKTDLSSEALFIDLVDTLNMHWPGPDHGDECNGQGTYETNKKYCSSAGLNRYEPIMQKGLESDLIPALHEFAKAAHDLSSITIARGPRKGQTMTGAEVLEITTKVLFSQDYAASVHMLDRKGQKSSKWTDGTAQAQLTGFDLFTDALHGIDTSFAADGDDGALRQKMWKRGRSQLVDAFLAVDGEGTSAHFKNKATVPLLIGTLKLLRQQLNANCPDRETTHQCKWGKVDFGQKLADTISSPLFASMMDVTEAVRQDNGARREMERYLAYLLASAKDQDTLQGTLASMVDLMQVLSDDAKLTPIIQAAAVAAKPEDDSEPGCADRSIRVLKALTDDHYDQYHVMDHILANLVTPIDDGAGPTLSPVEIIMDSIADIHRADPSNGEPLDPADYALIMGTVRDFMTDENRGLEQFYAIINNRQRK